MTYSLSSALVKKYGSILLRFILNVADKRDIFVLQQQQQQQQQQQRRHDTFNRKKRLLPIPMIFLSVPIGKCPNFEPRTSYKATTESRIIEKNFWGWFVGLRFEQTETGSLETRVSLNKHRSRKNNISFELRAEADCRSLTNLVHRVP